ncbi:MAG: BMP family ABC transporter substrate-binding protein [Acidovorax sp.]|jgi:simple sugar transport system substrate-binding protein|nr:BMP family ABC transporter substrate-binding protein [Acidovorax sp.]
MRSLCAFFVPTAVALGGVVAMASAQAADPMKVGFMYIGPAGGAGWSHAHELARQEVQKKFGNKVETIFVENVAENDAERVTRDLAAQGAKVIFGGAFPFMNGMHRVARDFPKVAFEHATGFKGAPNLGLYDIRTYEGACLNGTIAGHMSKSNTIGVVAPVPIPEIVRNINAFTLCARAVNPKVQTRLLWVNTFYDPPKEAEAAKTLINQGADVLMQNTDSPAPLQVAKERGAYGFGWDTDMSQWGGAQQLAAARLDWSGYYSKVVGEVLAGTWKPGNVWLGMKDGAIHYDHFSAKLPANVRKAVEQRGKDIASGKQPVFAGTVRDQSGKVRISGAELPDADKLQMNWLVEGVIGNLPR